MLRLVLFIGIAMVVGKLVNRVKLPAILGWLLTGMLIGPHALGWMNQEMMDASWFHLVTSIGEVGIGILIGTELIWKELKKSGKRIATICIAEALGTFMVVTLGFGMIFFFIDIPVYLAFVFGAIALATAPAPSLSIINEYQAKGPIAKTLIPLAALDDLIALVVFFVVIGTVANIVSGASMSFYVIPVMIILPVVLGGVLGLIATWVLQREMSSLKTSSCLLGCIIGVALVGLGINQIVGKGLINLMIMGVSFSATFANKLTEQRREQVLKDIQPVIGVLMIIAVLDLGAPLDYHLILGAGAFTFIYIATRAIGKLGGAYLGARVSHAPDVVRKYLGFTLLPHSGVSLVFTGIAVNTLMVPAPEYALVIQGTIAAAAVINEIIAVFLAKQGLKRAGEIQKEPSDMGTEEHLPMA